MGARGRRGRETTCTCRPQTAGSQAIHVASPWADGCEGMQQSYLSTGSHARVAVTSMPCRSGSSADAGQRMQSGFGTVCNHSSPTTAAALNSYVAGQTQTSDMVLDTRGLAAEELACPCSDLLLRRTRAPTTRDRMALARAWLLTEDYFSADNAYTTQIARDRGSQAA